MSVSFIVYRPRLHFLLGSITTLPLSFQYDIVHDPFAIRSSNFAVGSKQDFHRSNYFNIGKSKGAQSESDTANKELSLRVTFHFNDSKVD